jgi:pyruvate dehydrogenase E2 component (dihydrolipoamide acetyltransferase)
MAELRMPSLGADMQSGRLLEWHVAPGDTVKRGDIVATVDTDKADIDIETFDAGVVDALLVEPGTKVDVGTVIARIGSDGAAPAQAPETPAPAAPAAPPVPPVGAPAHRRRVSPLARRVAADLGVDVEALTGSGPGGAVTKQDVERAAQPTGVERRSASERLASLRQAVGELMARSKREIPHFHLTRELDLSAALAWLEAHNRERSAPERVLPAALLLRAALLAAHDEPSVNGTFEDGAFSPAERVDVGVAISLRGGGVIAPVIPAADELTLPDLMQALRELTDRVRRGALRGSDFVSGTLTVTSLGEHGADLVHGVIFPPQVALVGFGAIRERPWASGGMLGVRPTIVATLAGDHRVSEGHAGSLYLDSVDHHLQEPGQL